MYLYIFFSVITVIYFVHGLEEGDTCILSITRQQGICKKILSCPAALEEIKLQKFPQTCGFAGSVPRVCCANVSIPTANSSHTTMKLTTSTTGKTTPKVEATPTISSKPLLVNPYKVDTPGHKTFEKCLEYSRSVFTYEKPPILIIDKEEQKENACGFRAIPLIVGGELANRREFPHMALVGYDSPEGTQWLCGGSLISETFVLTAGHCLISKEYGNATHVRLGVVQINNLSHRQDKRVIQLIRYPDYSPPSLYNDIGLLKLKSKVDFNIYVRPACLHTFHNSLGDKAIATGWGKTDFVGYSSDHLMKVTLELSTPTVCYDSFSRISKQRLERGIDDTLMICAGSSGKDTCQGDSGGPLQIYSNIDCMYEIIGITSFGKACGIGKSPGVYTRVSHYIDWLEKIIFN